MKRTLYGHEGGPNGRPYEKRGKEAAPAERDVDTRRPKARRHLRFKKNRKPSIGRREIGVTPLIFHPFGGTETGVEQGAELQYQMGCNTPQPAPEKG